MTQFKGSVGYIGEKRFGGKTFYSFTVKGTDGFFRLGTNKPAFKVNAQVEFEADDVKNVIGEVKSLAERGPSDGGDSTVAGAKVVNFREEADAKRQKSIHFQSAHKDAIEMAQHMISAETVKMPTTASKKYKATLDLINELTDYFFQQFEAGKTEIAPVDPYTADMTQAEAEDAGDE